MTDYQIARWVDDHLRELHNTPDGKLAVFKISGKLVSVPIDRQSWRIALKSYKTMAVVRETVMALAMNE